MTHYIVRCKHCKTKYMYQGSGNGCHNVLNDKDYCPDCKKVVLEALKSVPKKFVSETIQQDEVTLDMVLEWENLNDKETMEKSNGFPICKRVLCGLIDVSTGESTRIQIVKGRDEFKGKQYVYRYWPSDKENGTVRLFVERNLETNEIKVCDEFYNGNESEKL